MASKKPYSRHTNPADRKIDEGALVPGIQTVVAPEPMRRKELWCQVYKLLLNHLLVINLLVTFKLQTLNHPETRNHLRLINLSLILLNPKLQGQSLLNNVQSESRRTQIPRIFESA